MVKSVGWLALSVIVGGCSAVLPLGSEFTFEQDEEDGGVRPDAAVTDAQVDVDVDAGVDASTCVPVTMEEACAARCGEVVVCGETFGCGGCPGALSCSADNECGCAASPCALWSRSHGDVAMQKLVAIAVDGEGNLFAAGDFVGAITFGSESYTNGGSRPDMFLVKYSRQGQVSWSKHFHDALRADNTQRVADIAVDGAGNVVLVGVSTGSVDFGGGARETDSDIVLVKLDGDGEHIFSDVYGNNFGPVPVSLAIHPSSYDIYLAGHFWGTLQFGTTSPMTAAGDQAYYDLFVVRFDATGAPQRARRYGDGLDQNEPLLAVTEEDLFLATVFRGALDFGSRTDPLLAEGADYEIGLAKLGATGVSTFLDSWSKKVSGYLAALAASADGSVYLGGEFQGDLDLVDPPLHSGAYAAFLARLDTDGVAQWAHAYPDARLDDVVTGSGGALYVAGRVYGEVDFGGGQLPYSGTGSDAFIASFDADGTHRWSRVFASAGDQRADAVAVGGSSVWIGATFEGTLDLGVGAHTTEGGTDLAVARFLE